MCKFLAPISWRLSIITISMFTLYGMMFGLQQANSEEVAANDFAEVVLPVMEEPIWTEEVPVLTPEQQEQLEYWSEHTHLPGPVLDEAAALSSVGPVEGTESNSGEERVRSMEPLLPGDAQVYLKKHFESVIPSGFRSNVMESSVGTGGKYVFFTGNWFAARNKKGGGGAISTSWVHVSPFTGFPDFCCDQIAIYDESRDLMFWLRMGIPSTRSGNFENDFKLSVSRNGMQSFWTYTIEPMAINASWTNQWWDYPHIQLGADFLYMTWNIFNSAGQWTRTVILRVGLDDLAAVGPFTGSFFESTSWFTMVPVQGAYHTMYFASNWPNTTPQNSRIGIWSWAEDSTTLFFWDKTVTAWTATFRGDALCGSTSGNWAARYDQRVLTGARYSIQGTDVKFPGRKVLGWWWNVGQGGSFPRPYIEAAAFFEDTKVQVTGLQGRPLVWNPSTCFAYPSCTPNKRQDLGMVFHYSTGRASNPSVGFAIADDFESSPPGWLFHNVITSFARPTDKRWGDYNTVREFEPTQKTWIAGSHYIRGSGACCNSSRPVYFVFGRERDKESWRRWKRK